MRISNVIKFIPSAIDVDEDPQLLPRIYHRYYHYRLLLLLGQYLWGHKCAMNIID